MPTLFTGDMQRAIRAGSERVEGRPLQIKITQNKEEKGSCDKSTSSDNLAVKGPGKNWNQTGPEPEPEPEAAVLSLCNTKLDTRYIHLL